MVDFGREPSNKDRDPNVRDVCGNCLKPDPRMRNIPIEAFIGNFVKLGFEISEESRKISITKFGRCPTTEHMWVLVTSKGTEGHELRGEVNNDPIHAIDWPCGTLLEFDRSEIEQFLTKPW